MAARLSKKRLPRYSREFKVKAVKLTRMAGMEVQGVAEALDIHPVNALALTARGRQRDDWPSAGTYASKFSCWPCQ